MARNGRVALDGVSICVAPGELLALCGPNGAGKSTLLGALAGDPILSDSLVTLDGVELRRLAPEILARRRAVLEQAPSLAAAFTVSELAALGASVAPLDGPSSLDPIITHALSAAGAQGFAATPLVSLSGGEQARAHFARVLAQLVAGRATEPSSTQALLLDEPTASLDLAHQSVLLRAALEIARDGVAVAAVLHDLNLAAAFADRVAILASGRLVAQGAPEMVLTSERLGSIYGVSVVVDRAPSGSVRVTPDYASRTPL